MLTVGYRSTVRWMSCASRCDASNSFDHIFFRMTISVKWHGIRLTESDQRTPFVAWSWNVCVRVCVCWLVGWLLNGSEVKSESADRRRDEILPERKQCWKEKEKWIHRPRHFRNSDWTNWLTHSPTENRLHAIHSQFCSFMWIDIWTHRFCVSIIFKDQKWHSAFMRMWMCMWYFYDAFACACAVSKHDINVFVSVARTPCDWCWYRIGRNGPTSDKCLTFA